MSRHITEDWCHICGERKDRLCDVWYPTNAELDRRLRSFRKRS